MKARNVIKHSCLAAALSGLLFAGGAWASPAQSPLAASIHQGTRNAIADIRAGYLTRPLTKAPTIVPPPAADAAIGRSIAARSRQAIAAIRHAQNVEIRTRSATLLTVAMREARPRHTREVALWQRALDAESGEMLEIIRSIAENAAFRWLPGVSLRISAPNAPGVR